MKYISHTCHKTTKIMSYFEQNKQWFQGSKLTLASSHFASDFHQTASAKLYHTHFSATRTLALIIHDSHQNSVWNKHVNWKCFCRIIYTNQMYFFSLFSDGNMTSNLFSSLHHDICHIICSGWCCIQHPYTLLLCWFTHCTQHKCGRSRGSEPLGVNCATQ